MLPCMAALEIAPWRWYACPRWKLCASAPARMIDSVSLGRPIFFPFRLRKSHEDFRSLGRIKSRPFTYAPASRSSQLNRITRVEHGGSAIVLLAIERDERAAEAQGNRDVDGIRTTQPVLRGNVGRLPRQYFVERDDHEMRKPGNRIRERASQTGVRVPSADRRRHFGQHQRGHDDRIGVRAQPVE